MMTTRSRRIVRRAVVGLTTVLILPTSYVGSVLCLVYAAHARLLPPALANSDLMGAYVGPLFFYGSHIDLPGSESCMTAIDLAMHAGQRSCDESMRVNGTAPD